MAPKSSAEKMRALREREKKKESRRDAVRKVAKATAKDAKSQRRAPLSATESGPHSDGYETHSNGAYTLCVDLGSTRVKAERVK